MTKPREMLTSFTSYIVIFIPYNSKHCECKIQVLWLCALQFFLNTFAKCSISDDASVCLKYCAG